MKKIWYNLFSIFLIIIIVESSPRSKLRVKSITIDPSSTTTELPPPINTTTTTAAPSERTPTATTNATTALPNRRKTRPNSTLKTPSTTAIVPSESPTIAQYGRRNTRVNRGRGQADADKKNTTAAAEKDAPDAQAAQTVTRALFRPKANRTSIYNFETGKQNKIQFHLQFPLSHNH